jgi:NNP family nitrate/nitrite transporter-like MFS transporter
MLSEKESALTGATAAEDQPVTVKNAQGLETTGSLQPPPFAWSQLWSAPVVNPVNLKCYTLPILTLNNPYSRSFHLAWISFFVAFRTLQGLP